MQDNYTTLVKLVSQIKFACNIERKALGFEGYFQHWLEMLYSHDAPQRRRLRINGETGEYFELGSGVPQGDPLSPLAFLFVTEAFSRLIESEDSDGPKGIDIAGIDISRD